jgi:formylglycine-generating enzyme required for sulfatase activity
VTAPQASGKGGLQIKSNPSGAKITVNGKDRGPAPQTMRNLKPGTYQVGANLAGYQTEVKTITVNSGHNVVVTFYLDRTAPAKGRLYVSTDPADAVVRIMDVGRGFTNGIALDSGHYKVQVAKNGYETKREWVTVEAGKSVDLYVELDPKAIPSASAEPASRSWTEPFTDMQFIWVPGGCYQMGCGSWTSNCYDDEKPVHKVCLDGFWIGKYEVTQGQWEKVMGKNPSHFNKGDDWPVEQVAWYDAQKFISKLNARSNGKYSFKLPTESQWEYAARSGGKKEKYAGGSDVDRLAWYDSNSGRTTHRVGTKAPNGLGIYDMSGNVWEWCSDRYGDYPTGSVTDPEGPSGGTHRVYRGGGWDTRPRLVRCTYRRWFRAYNRYNSFLGFRLSRTVK